MRARDSEEADLLNDVHRVRKVVLPAGFLHFCGQSAPRTCAYRPIGVVVTVIQAINIEIRPGFLVQVLFVLKLLQSTVKLRSLS